MEEDFKKFIESITNKNPPNPAEYHLKRVLGESYFNPYDVFEIDFSSNIEDISKKYKLLAKYLHPDINSDPRAKEAFEIINKNYEILKDPTKRRIFSRIMKEAYDRTVYSRESKNKELIKKGCNPLPIDTFELEYKNNCKEIYKEINEKKEKIEKIEESKRRIMENELNLISLKEHYKLLNEEEWEKGRKERIDKWKNFKSKKSVLNTNKEIKIYPKKDKISVQKISI